MGKIISFVFVVSLHLLDLHLFGGAKFTTIGELLGDLLFLHSVPRADWSNEWEMLINDASVKDEILIFFQNE